jgi:tetratricopeptide (TPR) repeat protein
MIGLSVILAWGAADIVQKWPRLQPAVVAVAVGICLVWMSLTWKQASHWQNSETLYVHAIEVTSDNFLAEGNLGYHLMRQPERRTDAIEHLEASLRIMPTYAEAHNNLGLCLLMVNLNGAAMQHFKAAIQAKPYLAEAYNNLGSAMINSEQYPEAVTSLEIALRIRPDYPDAHFLLGIALSRIPGRDLDAVAQFEAGLRFRPRDAEGHRKFGLFLKSLGRTEEANRHFQIAQHLQPEGENAEILEQLRPNQ